MNKIYEVETQRSNITPKAFFNHCMKLAEKNGFNLEDWADFKSWCVPTQKELWHMNKHEDWDEPKTEGYKAMPYDSHVYLQGSYNFIMEFDFDTETKGHGYMYAVEFER